MLSGTRAGLIIWCVYKEVCVCVRERRGRVQRREGAAGSTAWRTSVGSVGCVVRLGAVESGERAATVRKGAPPGGKCGNIAFYISPPAAPSPLRSSSNRTLVYF